MLTSLRAASAYVVEALPAATIQIDDINSNEASDSYSYIAQQHSKKCRLHVTYILDSTLVEYSCGAARKPGAYIIIIVMCYRHPRRKRL
jgi:hypothetical protein